MNVKIILSFIACIAFTNAGVLKVENEDVTRSILGDTINKTVESLRTRLAEYDPLSLQDRTISVPDVGDVQVGSVEASGFSNFALTSLSAVALTRTVSGTLRLPGVNAAVRSLDASSESAGVQASISSLDAALSGATVDFKLNYQLVPLQITSLSVLAQVEGVNVAVAGNVNDQSVNVQYDDAAAINALLSDNQETISSVLLQVVNLILERVGSSSSYLQ